MAYALDTNLFVYAHFEQYAEHDKAREFLQDILNQPDPFYLSWQICYEYIRIVTHPKVHRIPLTISQALQDMESYLLDPRCRILVETENHQKILKEVIKLIPGIKGNLVHDCHYAALLREHTIQEIVTADMDFKKFDFLKVINPFQRL